MILLLKMNNGTILNALQINYLKQHLSNNIFLKSMQFKRWQDRQAFLGGRYLLAEGLKKINIPSEIISEIRYTVYGRPYLPSNIDFNISHSGKFIICAICVNNRIGIDIEKIKIINLEDYRNQFNEIEFQNIINAQDKYKEFFRLWTIKEAAVKANGKGMNLELRKVLVDGNVYIEGKAWYVYEIEVSLGYVAHFVIDYQIEDTINLDLINIPEF